MTLTTVVQNEGPPTDTRIATYYYRNRGRIVFGGSVNPSDTTKILRVQDDVMGDGIAP